MKIGFFDSGVGGLFILNAVARRLPQYDYVFLGDTKNLPYGEKTQAQIYKLTTKALEFLFSQNCELVIVACNTSSAQALRKIQQDFLPQHYPKRKVLGVIRPTVELIKTGETCVLATSATTKAGAYTRELRNVNASLRVTELAAPELVPLIESNQFAKVEIAIDKYSKLVQSKKVKNLILGCTHYAIIKDKFAKRLGKGVNLISQDKIIPDKLEDYLRRHKEVASKLSKNRQRQFFVTKVNKEFVARAKEWFGQKVNLELAKY